MLTIKPVGRKASAVKYDILTALGAYALSRSKHDQRLVLRLITLITARYNWAHNELAVGQREIARLWSVDERTVKREMAKLRALGWLVVRRQGARGHVTEYRIDRERMLEDTRENWDDVGPDFAFRMQGTPEPEKVIPLPVKGISAAPDLSDTTEWGLAKIILHRDDPATYGSWFAALVRVERAGARLTLAAPTRFHSNYVNTHLTRRLRSACLDSDHMLSDVVVRH